MRALLRYIRNADGRWPMSPYCSAADVQPFPIWRQV